MSSGALQAELAYFERRRREFVVTAPGKFVVVKGNEHLGFFDDADEAYRNAVEAYGIQPFLIKQITPEDRVHQIPAHFLGLTHTHL